MRWGIGHFMAVAGALLMVGPFVAPNLYDAFAAPMTIFFGLAFLFLGLTFRKLLPHLGGTGRDRRRRSA